MYNDISYLILRIILTKIKQKLRTQKKRINTINWEKCGLLVVLTSKLTLGTYFQIEVAMSTQLHLILPNQNKITTNEYHRMLCIMHSYHYTQNSNYWN